MLEGLRIAAGENCFGKLFECTLLMAGFNLFIWLGNVHKENNYKRGFIIQKLLGFWSIIGRCKFLELKIDAKLPTMMIFQNDKK